MRVPPAKHRLHLIFAVVVALASLVRAFPSPCVHAQGASPAELARAAVSADPAEAARAVQALRLLGPAGHQALMSAHATQIAGLRDGTLPTSPELERLRRAVDLVSGQRDGHASGLFFFDDLQKALAEARRRNVPVLSLRMLGRLDEEMSCANSRYFRTLLYPDEAVARALRERFVLHVSVERPAPRITIDMGDGRTMVRTITGNSAHYVLDTRGRVIDVIPGLYAPAQFVAALDAASRRVTACGTLEGGRFTACIATQHDEALAALSASWEQRRRADPSLPTYGALVIATTPAPEPMPSARDAMATTMSKMFVEAPVLDRIARRPTPALPEPLDFVAVTARERAPLSARVLTLLRLKTGTDDVSALASSLVANATADGVRNELVLHRRIHALLAAEPTLTDFTALNTRVYAEIFRTPADDPWLGLRADDVWDAIEAVH